MVRALIVALLVGCSASGGSSDTTSPDAKTDGAVVADSTTSSDTSIDTSVADDTTPAGGDAIFPTEDTSIGDVSSCPDCIDVAVNVADCGSVMCPSTNPYPIGCSITMGGSDSRGCVVHASGSSTVTFKVGSACSGTADGFVTGIVRCAKTPGLMLNAMSCPISKPQKYYVMTLGACP